MDAFKDECAELDSLKNISVSHKEDAGPLMSLFLEITKPGLAKWLLVVRVAEIIQRLSLEVQT